MVGALSTARDITEQNEAQARVLENEQRFRLAMDATSDGLWEWDISTGRTYYSPAYFHMLGYKVGEFPNTSHAWVDLIHPDDRERVLAVNQDCIDNHCQTSQVEYRMRAKDGQWHWILGRGQAVRRDADDKALFMVGTHQNITERVQREETNRVQAHVLDNIGQGVHYVDQQGIIRFTNPACDAMFGYAPGELVGEHVSVLYDLPPEESMRAVAKVAAALNESGRWTSEFRSRKKDGTSFLAWATITLLPGGGYPHSVSIEEDITEHKWAEQELVRSQQELAFVYDNAPVAMIVVDEDLRVVRAIARRSSSPTATAA